jgi:hypothetical protein
MPTGETGSVAASPELGEAIDSLLPYRETRPQGWWQWGTTTPAGYALWDTGLAADTSVLREIVLIAPPDKDDEVSAWVWSDRTPAMPPFGRYLMHAANLRYEARLLDSWSRIAPRCEAVSVRPRLAWNSPAPTWPASGTRSPSRIKISSPSLVATSPVIRQACSRPIGHWRGS